MSVFALVAASEFNADDFSRRFDRGDFDVVMAVDGGFAHLEAIGVDPDIVLGDFDSLGFAPQHRRVIAHPPQKDKSDLELALDLAFEEGAKRVWAYGCLGGRIDHTISALQSLTGFAERGVEVSLMGSAVPGESGFQQGAALHILVGPGRLCLTADGGEERDVMQGTLSVHAACDRAEGVSENGLFYPLHDAVLTNRTSRGLSNELMGTSCSVEVIKGTVYVVCPPACRSERVILLP